MSEKTSDEAVTSGVGNVLEKWEFVFRLLKDKVERRNEGEETNDEEEGKGSETKVLDSLNRCYSFDDLTPFHGKVDQEKLGEFPELQAFALLNYVTLPKGDFCGIL